MGHLFLKAFHTSSKFFMFFVINKLEQGPIPEMKLNIFLEYFIKSLTYIPFEFTTLITWFSKE